MKKILRKAWEAGNYVVSEVNSKARIGKLRYSIPDLVHPRVELMSEDAEAKLAEMREKGVIQFRNEKTIRMAEHIAKTYIQPFEGNPQAHVQDPRPLLQISPESGKKGAILLGMIPFSDPIVRDFVLDPDFIGIIYNFLGRQMYFTKPPVIQCVNGDEFYSGACEWHTHYYHPMVVQVMLRSVTAKQPHLEYIKGTYHERFWEPAITTAGSGANNRVLRQVDAAVAAAKPEEIFMGHGEIGTVNLMDSRGFHRMALGEGGRRDILQLQISTGYSIKPFSGKEYPKNKERAAAMLADCATVMEQLKHAPAHVNASLKCLVRTLKSV